MLKDNHEHTTQYRCYHKLTPVDVVKVDYNDYANYYDRKQTRDIR